MPAPAKPARSLINRHKRARRVFARLMAGEQMRAIAASETLSSALRQAETAGNARKRETSETKSASSH